MVAKYPIDEWEKEKRPAFSVRQWCMLCQLVAENDMDNLSIIWDLAQDIQDKEEKEDCGSDDDHLDDDPDYYAKDHSKKAKSDAGSSKGAGPSAPPKSKSSGSGNDKDRDFVTQMNEARDYLLERAGAAVKLKEICDRPGAAVLKPFFAKELSGKMDDWHDANRLYKMLGEALTPNERGREDHEPPTPSSVAKDSDPGWNKMDDTDKQDTYDQVAERFAVEDRAKMKRAKRKASGQRPQMEVDEEAAEASGEDVIVVEDADVDYSE